MTTTTALFVIALAGVLYIAGGLYAIYRLRKWMADIQRQREM